MVLATLRSDGSTSWDRGSRVGKEWRRIAIEFLVLRFLGEFVAGDPSQAQASQPMAFDVEHLGADAVRVEVIALLRQTIEVPVDKSGRRAVGVVFPGECHAQRFLDLLDREATIDDDLAFANRLEEGQLLVVFVLNLAHDLFQDVFDSDQPGGTTVFIGHDRDVDAIATQLPEEIVETLRFGNDVGRAQELA